MSSWRPGTPGPRLRQVRTRTLEMRARPLKNAPTTSGASRKTRQRKKTDGIFHPSGSPAEPVALQITHVDRPSTSTAPNPPCLLLQRSDDGRDRRFSISPRDPAPGARAAPPTRTFRQGETTRGPTPAEREASIAAGAAPGACARKPARGAGASSQRGRKSLPTRHE